jgi:hypothetical protein
LFFNFAELFDFGWYSLAQEMSFVDRYLPYFKQWLTTCPLSSLLPFQHLFTIVCSEICSLLLPPSLVSFQSSRPLCCVLVFSLLFIQFFFFFLQGSQFAQGAMLVYPRAVGLSNVSQVGLELAAVVVMAVAAVATHLFSQCNMA